MGINKQSDGTLLLTSHHRLVMTDHPQTSILIIICRRSFCVEGQCKPFSCSEGSDFLMHKDLCRAGTTKHFKSLSLINSLEMLPTTSRAFHFNSDHLVQATPYLLPIRGLEVPSSSFLWHIMREGCKNLHNWLMEYVITRSMTFIFTTKVGRNGDQGASAAFLVLCQLVVFRWLQGGSTH